jgi:putative hydrolase of the HAD superfamily
MSRLKAVFLDVGETLVYAHPSSQEIMAAICVEAGFEITAAQIEAAESKVWPRLQARQADAPLYSISAENSRRFWTSFYDQLLAELAVPQAAVPQAARGAIAAAMHERFSTLQTWRLYPDALPALEAIHERRERDGLTAGVVSNWEDWLETLLTHLEVHRYFDFFVISSAEQMEKPDPAIFRRALERANVPPDQALHVGDSLHADVGGARAAGVRPVLLDRRGRYAPDQTGDVTVIRSLAELPPLLDRRP